MCDPAVINIDTEKYNAWVKNGARPSDTVKRLYEIVSK